MAALYAPLAADGAEIRLITVHPPAEDNNQAAICCSMQPAAVNSRPKYEALSYVWGDATPAHTIKVNDQTVPVTASLFMALSTLRNIYSPRPFTIWVDALCINQQDAREKSSQIELMPWIYRESTGVVGYLGEAGRDSDYAIATFIKIANEIRKECGSATPDDSAEPMGQTGSRSPPQPPNEPALSSREDPSLPTMESEWKPVELGLPVVESGKSSPRPSSKVRFGWLKRLPELTGADYVRPWLAMKRFLQRSYWKRVWIVQEAVLASHLRLLCGTKSLTWNDLSLCALQFGLPSRLHEAMFDDFPSLRRLHLTDEWVPLISIQSLRLSMNLDSMPIFGVVLTTTRAKATDPRDHIYGLLGIAKEYTTADYTRTVEDLYYDFSSRWIEWMVAGKPGLDSPLVSPLQRAGISYRRKIASLPSWVVDLSSLDESGKRQCFIDYKASGGTLVGSAGLTVCGQNLLLKGAVVDTISQVWEFYDHDHPVEDLSDGRMLLGPRSRIVYDILLNFSDAQDGMDPEKVLQTTLMALMLGRYEPYDTRLEMGSSRLGHLFEGFELFSALGFNLTNLDLPTSPEIAMNVLEKLVAKRYSTHQRANEDRDALEPLWTLFQRLYERSFGQAVFLTSGGRLGVGTRFAREGDVVCIVPGHIEPFLLRPDTDQDYELVCPAYVQGFMDGEAVGEDVDAWLSSLQDIRIK